MFFLLKVMITAVSAMLAAYLLPGVAIAGFLAAVVFAFVLALLNAVLKPILIILTIPVTILTFGLFLLVINVLMILLADTLVAGFRADGFWFALLFSIVLSVISSLLGVVFDRKRNVRY